MPEDYDYNQELARAAFADMLHDSERNQLYRYWASPWSFFSPWIEHVKISKVVILLLLYLLGWAKWRKSDNTLNWKCRFPFRGPNPILGCWLSVWALWQLCWTSEPRCHEGKLVSGRRLRGRVTRIMRSASATTAKSRKRAGWPATIGGKRRVIGWWRRGWRIERRQRRRLGTWCWESVFMELPLWSSSRGVSTAEYTDGWMMTSTQISPSRFHLGLTHILGNRKHPQMILLTKHSFWTQRNFWTQNSENREQ